MGEREGEKERERERGGGGGGGNAGLLSIVGAVCKCTPGRNQLGQLHAQLY